MRFLLQKVGMIGLIALLSLPLAVFAQSDVPAPANGGSIVVGDEIEGELTSDEPAIAYTISVEEETSFIAVLASEDFDCYLTLLDQDGTQVAFDDDGAGNLDSRLSFTAQPGETYTLVAQSYLYHNGSSGATGNFTLTISQSTVTRIEYGQRISGELTRSQLEVRYTFNGSAGDVIISEHFAPTYDSYLILEQNGSQLAYNDDGAGNLDSRIGPFTLPTTGEYTLVVTSLSRNDVGTYEVTLSRVEVGDVVFNEPVSVEFTDETQGVYLQFDGELGDVISVEVDGDIDSNIAISDPSNYVVASDEDGGAGKNPELSEVSLTSTGVYTIAINSTAGEVGTVHVTVRRAELPNLSDGPQRITFSSSTYTRTLSFDGVAGTTYRLTLETSSGQQGAPSVEITQSGQSLGYTSTGQVSRLSLDVTPPSTGEVIIRISDYSYTNLAYDVTLEEVGE